MRRSIVLFVAVVAALGVAACSSSSDKATTTTAATTSVVRTPDTSTPQTANAADRQLCAQAQTVANAQQSGTGLSQALNGFATTYTQVQGQLSAPAKATLQGYDPKSTDQAATVNDIEQYLVWCSGQG
ncbi:MAG: hypothetical protein ACOYNI_04305 [Acidimicrobiia bacterium]